MDPRPRIRAWGVLLAIAAFGVAVFVLRPGETSWLPPCPFHYLTGLYCPGCGTLRGLHALMRGSLIGAWRSNLLMVLCLPLLLYAIAGQVSVALRGRSVRELSFSPLASKLALVVILAYMAARNVPCYPFNLLAPR